MIILITMQRRERILHVFMNRIYFAANCMHIYIVNYVLSAKQSESQQPWFNNKGCCSPYVRGVWARVLKNRIANEQATFYPSVSGPSLLMHMYMNIRTSIILLFSLPFFLAFTSSLASLHAYHAHVLWRLDCANFDNERMQVVMHSRETKKKIIIVIKKIKISARDREKLHESQWREEKTSHTRLKCKKVNMNANGHFTCDVVCRSGLQSFANSLRSSGWHLVDTWPLIRPCELRKVFEKYFIPFDLPKLDSVQCEIFYIQLFQNKSFIFILRFYFFAL